MYNYASVCGIEATYDHFERSLETDFGIQQRMSDKMIVAFALLCMMAVV